MLALFLSAAIAFTSPPSYDEPLPVVDVKLHAWGVEFIGSDGVQDEVEWFVFDPIALDIALESDPITIDDCLATAQIACPHGIKRFYYRAGDPAVCEFECFPGTGGGA